MPSSAPSASSTRYRVSWRATGPPPRWVKPAVWALFALFLVAVVQFVVTREPDRLNARDTYDAFSEALVEGDYERAFGLLDDDMAVRFGSPDELSAYLAGEDFFPIDYRLGVLSSRINTIRFTMSNGTERDARMRVRGLRPEVVFFEIAD